MTQERLFELIDVWRDNDLSVDQAEDLNQHLRESDDARRTFSAETHLHGLLYCASAEGAIPCVADMPAATLRDGGRLLHSNSRPAWFILLQRLRPV